MAQIDFLVGICEFRQLFWLENIANSSEETGFRVEYDGCGVVCPRGAERTLESEHS